MQKGISPLVAAVLLIAVTMTIAGVLAYWASTFVRGQTDTFANQTVASECNFASFVVEACSYDQANERMTFILNNVGSIDLNNVTVFTIYPDNTVNSTGTGQGLPSATLKSFSVSGVSPGFSTVSIRTHCPIAFVETTCR